MKILCYFLSHKYHSWVSASKWVVGDEKCLRCGESYKEEKKKWSATAYIQL